MAIASTELVEREIRIDAPPSVVFEFLTDPAKMVCWMGTEAVLEPWPGGRYYVNVSGHEAASGEVLEIIPERRLVFSWGWEDGALPLRPGQSTVEISLEPDGDGTRLRLTHRDLPPDMHSFHGVGWDYALPRLAVVAAGGDPGPDPVRSIIRGTLMAARSLAQRWEGTQRATRAPLGEASMRDHPVETLPSDNREEPTLTTSQRLLTRRNAAMNLALGRSGEGCSSDRLDESESRCRVITCTRYQRWPDRRAARPRST